MRRSYQEAFLGFIGCAAGTLAIFSAMYFGAPYLAQQYIADIAKNVEFTEAQALAFKIDDLRFSATNFLYLVLPTFAVYWFVAGLLGMAPILKSKAANAFLIAGVLGVIAIAANNYFYWVETYCDVQPYSHQRFQISRISECPSSRIFVKWLFGSSVILLLISLVVRLFRLENNGSAKT